MIVCNRKANLFNWNRNVHWAQFNRKIVYFKKKFKLSDIWLFRLRFYFCFSLERLTFNLLYVKSDIDEISEFSNCFILIFFVFGRIFVTTRMTEKFFSLINLHSYCLILILLPQTRICQLWFTDVKTCNSSIKKFLRNIFL